MMNFINERAFFFDVYKLIFINIENIIISTFIFVIECSNYNLFLDRSFQCIVCINVVNMNNNLLKMILYLLNNEKQMNFLKMSAKHINNKNEKFVFTFKTLNI